MNVVSFIKSLLKKNAPNEPAGPLSLGDRLRRVVGALNQNGIKAHYDPPAAAELDPTAPSRVLLFSTRYNARNFEMATECNGLILDYRGTGVDVTAWPVVCNPTALPNAQFSVKRVAENFEHYDVYPLRDGTVVNLYHYGGKWCIATARGLDMGAVEWRGITYQAALEEAMRDTWRPALVDATEIAGSVTVAVAETPALTFADLEPGRTYTMGFTHPLMHHTQSLAVWLIRGDLEHPTLEVQDRTAEYTTFAEVQAACRDLSYKGWGFILRSRDPAVTGADSTVLIESRRMQLARTLVYDRYFRDEAAAVGATPQEWAFASCMRDESSRENYLVLWPEHAELQQAAVTELTRLSEVVALPQITKSTGDSPKMVAWVRAHMGIAGNITHTPAQVLGYMLTPNNLSVIFEHLREMRLLPGELSVAAPALAHAE